MGFGLYYLQSFSPILFVCTNYNHHCKEPMIQIFNNVREVNNDKHLISSHINQ